MAPSSDIRSPSHELNNRLEKQMLCSRMRGLHLLISPSSLITEEHKQTQGVNQTDWGEKAECSTPSTPGLASERSRNMSVLLPLCVPVLLLRIRLFSYKNHAILEHGSDSLRCSPAPRLLLLGEITGAPSARTCTFC